MSNDKVNKRKLFGKPLALVIAFKIGLVSGIAAAIFFEDILLSVVIALLIFIIIYSLKFTSKLILKHRQE